MTTFRGWFSLSLSLSDLISSLPQEVFVLFPEWGTVAGGFTFGLGGRRHACLTADVLCPGQICQLVQAHLVSVVEDVPEVFAAGLPLGWGLPRVVGGRGFGPGSEQVVEYRGVPNQVGQEEAGFGASPLVFRFWGIRLPLPGPPGLGRGSAVDPLCRGPGTGFGEGLCVLSLSLGETQTFLGWGTPRYIPPWPSESHPALLWN